MSVLATTPVQSLVIPCDDRCMFAKSDYCDCECEGRNHQQGHRLTDEQRTILRTKAGRRIPVLTPGTADWNDARAIRALEEAGLTRKEIAAEFGCSQPVIRRLARSLEATEALIEALTA